MDLLSALAAGLIGCFHIDRLYQLSQHTRVDFFNVHVFVCRSDELFNIFALSFLYFNFMSQSDNLCFKLFLFRFVVLTHHIESLVTQIAFGVIFVNLDEQPFQICDSALVAFKLFAARLQLFCRLQLELLFHYEDEMLTVSENIPHDQLDVFQHHSLQHRLSDKVRTALILVFPMKRTIKERSLTLAVVGGSVVQLLTAIGEVHQTGKGARASRLGFALSLLANDLHLLKDILFDNGFVSVLKDGSFFGRILPLLLVPDGVGVGLEVDRTACVLLALQNMNYGTGIPSARVFGRCVGTLDALAVLVGGRGENTICL